ncbi:uncharacterized protein LOC100897659 [Galendromus occidentalis]|uniref:Uncharacterized protein LOC100897659 n=1 Tax=Galendromus occidentalis TaxID=34638 RepID=A0AAJ6QM74_9ACAR|nr:uncharacterized protein LOC100897659 [Galendromus occidentalis]
MKLFRPFWECLLRGTSLKAIVMISFYVYLVVGISGCMQLREETDRPIPRPDGPSGKVDLPAYWYLDPLAGYRYGLNINAGIDYWNVETRERLMAMLDEFESTTRNSTRVLTNCWFQRIPRLFGMEEARIMYPNSSRRDYQTIALKQMLRLKPFSEFDRDIKFNENDTVIVASRCKLRPMRVVDANDEKLMVRNLRRIVAKYPDLNSSINDPSGEGVLDNMSLVVHWISIPLIIRLLICFCFAPNSILSCLWTPMSVISVGVGAVGCFIWFGLDCPPIFLLLVVWKALSFHEFFTTPYVFLHKAEADSDEKMRAAFRCLLLLFVEFYFAASYCLYMMLTTETPKFVWVSLLKVVTLISSFECFHHMLVLPAFVTSNESFRKIIAKMSSISLV